MIEFLQTYGIWIVLGAFFILMMRSHMGAGSHGGMGCGMGGHGHDSRTNPEEDPASAEVGVSSKREKAIVGTDSQPTSRHSGGCH